jgi:hypothetical protein
MRFIIIDVGIIVQKAAFPPSLLRFGVLDTIA